MSPSEVFWLVVLVVGTSAAIAVLSYQLGYAKGRLWEMEEQREIDERADEAPTSAPASAWFWPSGPRWL